MGAVNKAETQRNLQFNFLWLYPFQKGFYIEFKHSTLSLILENQTANQTCTHSHIFWSQTKSLRLLYVGRENQRKRAFLDFQLGVVPGFVIALISPWVTLVPSIRQTFPFWMPKEKLLFDNGTLESDEETIWLCPAQSNTELPGGLEQRFSHLSIQEGTRGLWS